MAYDKNNVFAKILRKEIPSKKVYEDQWAYAFADIQPAAPKHILVIPKGDFESFHDFTALASPELQGGFWKAVRIIATEQGADKTGYRIISNSGPDASQSVPHFHVHILAGRPLGALLPEDVVTR